jgi:hypothetical protein
VQVRGVAVGRVYVDDDATELVVRADQQRATAAESLQRRQVDVRCGVTVLRLLRVVGDVGDSGEQVSGLQDNEEWVERDLRDDSRAEIARRDDDVVGPLRQRDSYRRSAQGRSATCRGGGPDVTEGADPDF